MKETEIKLYGLIGFPLGHSFSRDYFLSKFKKDGSKNSYFLNFPLSDIRELRPLIKSHDNLLGFSVTIPHKESVISLLDEISGEAREIGAVNAVKILRGGNEYRLKGYNTDTYGFTRSLLENYDSSKISKALILGSGGASKAVLYSLKKMGISCIVVSRTKRGAEYISYEEISPEIIASAGLIVNTTPLGMFPKVDELPDIPYELLGSQHLLFDLVYNPEKTLFLKNGEARGAIVINGLQMLKYQAEKAWDIWNDL